MAYIRISDHSFPLGSLGCGPNCPCAACRQHHAHLSEWYVKEDSSDMDPGRTSEWNLSGNNMYLYTREGLGQTPMYIRTLDGFGLQPTADPMCKTYEPGEIAKSKTLMGHLASDVIEDPKGNLLIADYGVTWRSVNDSIMREPQLTQLKARLNKLMDTASRDSTAKIRILGYSDCVGNERNNLILRQGRAKKLLQFITEIFGKDPRWSVFRSRIVFVGEAPLGEYVADNTTVEGRARNRSVVIELRRDMSLPKVECPRYEKGEEEKSHCQEGPCQQGHLVADVIRHPRGLLIADFGVGWSGIKAATRKEKLLQDWMGEAKTNLYSIILRIYGYSDCVGTEKNNQALRYARAERVYGLLDKALQSRVDFMSAARPGEYVADNKTKEGRANNRGVIIELFRLSEEIVDITDTRCLRPNCPPPPPPPKRCIPPDCPPHPPPPPPPKRCIPPDCPPPPPPKRPWKPPRIPIPDLSPKEILDRVREVVEYLKRNGGDQNLIKKLEGLLFEAGKIAALAGAVLGLYIFAKGKLVQVAVATGMVLPRILHRFETSGMKEALERILNELTDPKTTEPIKEEIRRTQPRAPKSALTECQETNPTFTICTEQLDIGPEKLVMIFLKNEGIDPNDVLGINCRKFNSFGPGVIDACNHAPGETWHCTVTTKVPGSPKPRVRVVSLFRCLCCRADGWAAHDWRGPHWSAG